MSRVPNFDSNPFSPLEWTKLSEALGLSAREVQICELLSADLTELEIANKLGISPHTVHTHIGRVFAKTQTASRTQLLVKLLVTFRLLPASEH